LDRAIRCKFCSLRTAKYPQAARPGNREGKQYARQRMRSQLSPDGDGGNQAGNQHNGQPIASTLIRLMSG
jgi:hypothetical protein